MNLIAQGLAGLEAPDRQRRTRKMGASLREGQGGKQNQDCMGLKLAANLQERLAPRAKGRAGREHGHFTNITTFSSSRELGSILRQA